MGGEQHSMHSLCPILGDGRKTRMLGVGRREAGGGRRVDGTSPRRASQAFPRNLDLFLKLWGDVIRLDSQFIFIPLLPNVFPILMLDKLDFRAKSII